MPKTDWGQCLICQAPLIKHHHSHKTVCVVCGGISETDLTCPDKHYVCPECLNLEAADMIEKYCINSHSDDALHLALILMRNPKVPMHDPIHHFITAAVLLTAYYNRKKQFNQKAEKIKEARKRLSRLHDCTIAYLGTCSSAIGAATFFSLINGATLQSKEELRHANLAMAKAMNSIATLGGPRCCKRVTFASILDALDVLREYYDTIITHTGTECEFRDSNLQCLGVNCPFYMINRGTEELL